MASTGLTLFVVLSKYCKPVENTIILKEIKEKKRKKATHSLRQDLSSLLRSPTQLKSLAASHLAENAVQYNDHAQQQQNKQNHKTFPFLVSCRNGEILPEMYLLVELPQWCWCTGGPAQSLTCSTSCTLRVTGPWQSWTGQRRKEKSN